MRAPPNRSFVAGSQSAGGGLESPPRVSDDCVILASWVPTPMVNSKGSIGRARISLSRLYSWRRGMVLFLEFHAELRTDHSRRIDHDARTPDRFCGERAVVAEVRFHVGEVFPDQSEFIVMNVVGKPQIEDVVAWPYTREVRVDARTDAVPRVRVAQGARKAARFRERHGVRRRRSAGPVRNLIDAVADPECR